MSKLVSDWDLVAVRKGLESVEIVCAHVVCDVPRLDVDDFAHPSP